MKAVLEFNFNSDEERFNHAVNGEKYYHALVELEGRLRRYMRDDIENAETFYDLFADVLAEHEVTIND